MYTPTYLPQTLKSRANLVLFTSAIFFLFIFPQCAFLPYLKLLECRSDYTDDRYSSPSYYYTNYPINATKKTPGGIRYDDSGLNLNMDQQNMLDELTVEYEECSGKKVSRCAYVVKIVDDAVTNSAGVMEFPCNANERKLCTGVIQYPAVIVITIDFAAYKHELDHTVNHSVHKPNEALPCQ